MSVAVGNNNKSNNNSSGSNNSKSNNNKTNTNNKNKNNNNDNNNKENHNLTPFLALSSAACLEQDLPCPFLVAVACQEAA